MSSGSVELFPQTGGRETHWRSVPRGQVNKGQGTDSQGSQNPGRGCLLQVMLSSRAMSITCPDTSHIISCCVAFLTFWGVTAPWCLFGSPWQVGGEVPDASHRPVQEAGDGETRPPYSNPHTLLLSNLAPCTLHWNPQSIRTPTQTHSLET